MKKSYLFILTSILLFQMITPALADELPASKSNTKSDVNITLLPGDEVPTKPVNPLDPQQPVDPDVDIDENDPGNVGTGNKGPLSLDYVSNIAFGENKIVGGTTTYFAKNQNPFVQVTDSRGTGDGWVLNASISAFENDSKNKTLTGAILSFKNATVKNTSEANLSVAPVANDIDFEIVGENYQVFKAKENTGKGTWLSVWSSDEKASEGLNENVSLTVPAGIAEANTVYNAAITWELSNTPEA